MDAFSWQYLDYLEAIRRAGGVPLPIAVDTPGRELRRAFETVSGVLLCGGPDIDPAAYGETAAPDHNVHNDPLIDAVDVQLARWAAAEDVPLLGICRGAQVMAVARNVHLWQDISRDIPNAQVHIGPSGETVLHDVTVTRDTHLAAIIGSGRHRVHSRHHQGIRSGSKQLKISGSADDGVVEGIEYPDRRFAIGVQWHPEECLRDPGAVALFAAFVRAAAARGRAVALE